MRSLSVSRRVALVALVTLLSTSCRGTNSETESKVSQETAAGYALVIEDVLSRHPIPVEETDDPTDPEELPIVYIEAFGEEGIDLEIQVELVAQLSDRYEVRFIDDMMEATEDELELQPVRSGTGLVGLWPMQGSAGDIQVEWYQNHSTVEAYRYSVRRSNGEPRLDGEPTVTEPLGFVWPS